MKAVLQFAAVLLIPVLLVFAFFRSRTDDRPRTRHPRVRSKSTGGTYQETNSAARLLSGVLALKERNAQWSEIMQALNPEDEPRIRTVLLELRWAHRSKPRKVLQAIEDICLASHRESSTLSTQDLLERAKSILSPSAA